MVHTQSRRFCTGSMGRRTPFYQAAQTCILGLVLLSFTSASSYLPEESSTGIISNNGFSFLHETPQLTPRDEKPFTLRIMPLGASITYGYQSTDGNGYRRWLCQQLRHAGWWVNMVGSNPNDTSTMNDNEVEATSGFRVDEVTRQAERTIPQQPNLILINAGTNDANQYNDTTVDVYKTGERMDALLTRLFDAIPGTTIILSTLLPRDAESQIVYFTNYISGQYRQIVTARRQKGQRIVLAEMSDFIKVEDLIDGTHPTDFGDKKVASVWWEAIQEAEREGLLQPPNKTGVSDTKRTTCKKEYGSGNRKGRVQTQRGSGADDGNYVHSSKDMGRIFSPATTKKEKDFDPGINYAQLVNKFGAHREGALDELVWTKDGDGTYMFINNNDGKFGSAVKIEVNDGCLARGVRWGDVNGDGLDDFICISREGHMYVSLNEDKDLNVPTFRSIGLVKDKPGNGLGQINVRLGDIDGDGRIDYCLAHNNGDIRCWRNGGQKDAPTKEYGGYWQDLGIVFKGKGMGDITGVRLVDINGDFRSDWLWLDEKGKVTTYINSRGTGKSLVPDWREAGVTHAGMGVDGAKNRIKFGRVYAGGGADYTWIESVKQTNGDWKHYTHVYKNTGHGGTKLKGDGVYYCDIRGTGADDYVGNFGEGRGYLYGNVHDPPIWKPEGIEIFNVKKDRKSLHLADFDGDGKCDLWAVKRDTGEAEVWLNKWSDNAHGDYFQYKGVLTGKARCTQGWGIGLYDLGLRFADLDGDGRADYLCMDPDGRTDGWLNKGENIFESIGQVKRSEHYDRASHRWADVNGDRMADFLWIDKFNGDTKVWINQGPVPTLDSKWRWGPQDGPRYMGADRGANMHFPNLGGLGRADYHQVIPRTNIAYTWFNECPNEALDDDDSTEDPKLPRYPAPAQPASINNNGANDAM
ncbi:GDSL-like Lipase/Acylhydrolase family protein [Aspergillus parasiticus SU-1]|uniref:GDSL-like Lipase/Acylhydrolase family protein n=1 Tax=Aspergillus parasiticus (strain ATCC 56775 / NRRL 5862 / SRRC 143 / SU-1) TaxID=1403190 RepID=A0A0F0I1G7_ASPPU|nr:GDSL-like Lipase/Acylhydrolase family protein [Aspergillus parasiticus SU-1]